MTVTVRLFARARDLAGVDALTLELPSQSTVSFLRERLGREVPALLPLLGHSVLAVNTELVDETTILPPDAEIALLPPVSGG